VATVDENNRPTVLAIYPEMGTWPANILRSHILFDRPMAVMEAVKHIKLLDDEDRDISDALLDLPDGLWTPDQRMLTVLFHPGRVKTGLNASAFYGSVFSVDRSYRLIVSGNICNSAGRNMGRDRNCFFQAGPPIRSALSLVDRQIDPQDGSIQIETNQPLDFLSAQTYLSAFDELGHRVAAEFHLSPDGKSAVVHSEGCLSVRSHPLLEDVAGNRISVPFETLAG
jgi:hypothetical protein